MLGFDGQSAKFGLTAVLANGQCSWLGFLDHRDLVMWKLPLSLTLLTNAFHGVGLHPGIREQSSSIERADHF